MRRKKNNSKQVLIPRNRQPVQKRQRRGNGRRKKKTSGVSLFIIIIALVAFVIGAGIGISLSFDDGSDDGPHYENVTKEMTTNLNDTEPIYFDKEVDGVDFNDNQTLTELNITDDVTPSY